MNVHGTVSLSLVDFFETEACINISGYCIVGLLSTGFNKLGIKEF